MNIPKTMNKYCPKCRKHTEQTIAKIKFSKSPTKKGAMSYGQKKQERKMKGYTSKLAGKKSVEKQVKDNVLIYECKECKKKQQRPYATLKKAKEFKKE